MRDAEAKTAAALQRLSLAREALEREEVRARERMSELDRRLVQLTDDIAREQRLSDDAMAALARLAAEEDTIGAENRAAEGQRARVAERVGEAEAALSASEKTFDKLTGSLAELAARRHGFESAIREHADRFDRLTGELRAVELELNELQAAEQKDLAALSDAATLAQSAVIEAEAAALAAEAAHSAARQALDVARAPLVEVERRAQRLDTEAKTLSKLFHVDSKNLWPAVIDDIAVYRHSLPLEARGVAPHFLEYAAALFHEFRLLLKVHRERGFSIIQACNPPDLIFLAAAPFTFLCLLCWSLGEFAGYVTAQPFPRAAGR